MDDASGDDNGGGDLARIGLHQGHGAGFHGDIGALRHGNAAMGCCQGRGIIKPVAHHRHHQAAFLQFGNRHGLLLRRDLGDHFLNVKHGSTALGGGPTVTGQHDRVYAHGSEHGNGINRVWPHSIGKANQRFDGFAVQIAQP